MMLVDAILVFAFSFWSAITINFVKRENGKNNLPFHTAFTSNVPECRPKIELEINSHIKKKWD